MNDHQHRQIQRRGQLIEEFNSLRRLGQDQQARRLLEDHSRLGNQQATRLLDEHYPLHPLLTEWLALSSDQSPHRGQRIFELAGSHDPRLQRHFERLADAEEIDAWRLDDLGALITTPSTQQRLYHSIRALASEPFSYTQLLPHEAQLLINVIKQRLPTESPEVQHRNPSFCVIALWLCRRFLPPKQRQKLYPELEQHFSLHLQDLPHALRHFPDPAEWPFLPQDWCPLRVRCRLTGTLHASLLQHAGPRHDRRSLWNYVKEPLKGHWLLLLSLDRFKNLNDQCSCTVGDHYLKDLSEALHKAFGDRLFRLSGDCFILIVNNKPERAAEQAHDIARACPIDSEYFSEPYRPTFSIGVAFTGQDPESALKAAEDAEYQAKLEGRNRTLFAPGFS